MGIRIPLRPNKLYFVFSTPTTKNVEYMVHLVLYLKNIVVDWNIQIIYPPKILYIFLRFLWRMMVFPILFSFINDFRDIFGPKNLQFKKKFVDHLLTLTSYLTLTCPKNVELSHISSGFTIVNAFCVTPSFERQGDRRTVLQLTSV